MVRVSSVSICQAGEPVGSEVRPQSSHPYFPMQYIGFGASYFTSLICSILICKRETTLQLTLGQHGFEPHRSTYMQNFFNKCMGNFFRDL